MIVSKMVEQESPRVTLSKELSDLYRMGAALAGGEDSSAEEVMKEALLLYIHNKSGQSSGTIQCKEKPSETDASISHSRASINERDSILFDKLSGLIVSMGLDTALTHVMMRDLYCIDNKSGIRYEKLRNVLASRLEKQTESDQTGKLELQETVRRLRKENTKFFAELKMIREQERKYDQKYRETHAKYVTLMEQFTKMAKILHGYTGLTRWHEQRAKEAPKIKKKNSSLIREQSWEGALREFEQYNPRPRIPPFDPESMGLSGFP
jgi:hypothetical protein